MKIDLGRPDRAVGNLGRADDVQSGQIADAGDLADLVVAGLCRHSTRTAENAADRAPAALDRRPGAIAPQEGRGIGCPSGVDVGDRVRMADGRETVHQLRPARFARRAGLIQLELVGVDDRARGRQLTDALGHTTQPPICAAHLPR
jgi:hypothetical protein